MEHTHSWSDWITSDDGKVRHCTVCHEIQDDCNLERPMTQEEIELSNCFNKFLENNPA